MLQVHIRKPSRKCTVISVWENMCEKTNICAMNFSFSNRFAKYILKYKRYSRLCAVSVTLNCDLNAVHNYETQIKLYLFEKWELLTCRHDHDKHQIESKLKHEIVYKYKHYHGDLGFVYISVSDLIRSFQRAPMDSINCRLIRFYDNSMKRSTFSII
jgi:hypothetical protein